MTMKKKILTTLSVVLILGMAAMGILAYLTSTDSDVNVMTLGNVKIDQIEQERIDTTGDASADNLREFTGNKKDVNGNEDLNDAKGKLLYPLTPGYEENGKDLWNGTKNAVDKLVSVKNTGKSEAYVRTWFAFEMGNMTLDEWKAKVKLNINETDWIWADGLEKVIEGEKYFVTYAVYKEGLSSGETTSYSLKQVALISDATNEDVEKLDADKDGNYEVWAYTQAVQVAGFEIASGATYCASIDLIDLPAAVALDTAFGTEHPWQSKIIYNGDEYNSLKEAVAAANANGGGTIIIPDNEAIGETIEITSNITIKSEEGIVITRADGFTGTMFSVGSGATLTVEGVTLDGAGATATGNLIAAGNNSKIVLNEGAILKNNNGAHAINLGTRIGATLTINGGEITNNSSDSGAIWGGGDIILNSGKISNNSSTGSAGAIRMVSNCNLTINGGEISNNTAAGSGGAIWGYGASTYNFNGGKMNGNTAAVGGAMYTGDGSTVNISGDFELCNNTADDAGALRLSNRTAFNMSDGLISGNESKNSPDWDGFYGWNPGVNISGGELDNDIFIQGGLTPTIGAYTGDGVIHFDLSTNHNTVNLATDFGTIKFTVAEGSNFENFNFKPADEYTYTAGDEAKLVCMNEGYETYWTGSVFKIKAK